MITNKIIQQAIEKEMLLGEYLLSSYSEKIKSFEKKYKITTSSFLRSFNNGKLGDQQDFFEWLALCKGRKHWQEKLSVLKAA